MPILMIALNTIKKAINIPKRKEPIMISKSSPCSAASASSAAINNHFPPITHSNVPLSNTLYFLIYVKKLNLKLSSIFFYYSK